MRTISPTELDSENDATIIDLRLADDYDFRHVTNAISNCVFEVAFADRLAEQIGSKSQAVVIYGADGMSHEAIMAAEKMAALGYENGRILEGGLQAWLDADLPTGGDGAEPKLPEIPEGSLSLDLEQTRIEWTGRNLLNKHFGTIGIRSGEIEIVGGELVGGTIVIDMDAIVCSDLDGEMHDGLVSHLKSDDFFDTKNHPEATLVITSSRRIEAATIGNQNLIIRADFTLKGKTAPIEIGAVAGITPEGALAAQASFLIDRTVWDVIYGSGRFFHRLGQHLVNDLVDIDLKVVTESK